jgi:hypothetical protein
MSHWKNVARAGMPPCDGETVYVGINEAGYACCFNLIDKRGWCVMRSPEDSQDQMSALRWWRVLHRPDVEHPKEQMRADFEAWVQDRGCDTDGAWSAWQACWNLLSAPQ